MSRSDWRGTVLSRCAIAASVGLTIGQLFVTPAIAGTNSFTPVGPYGGAVYKVVYHPTNPTIAYAATSGGFYRSTDGGSQWQLVDDTMADEPRDIAVHPAQPNRVFATTAGSLLSSNDAGAALATSTSFPGGDRLVTNVEYSADGTALYVTSGLRIYRSPDQGATWQLAGEIPGPTDGAINTLAVDPTDTNALYVISGELAFHSADGGATWQAFPLPVGSPDNLAIANTTPRRIWTGVGTGIYSSDDLGQHWNLSFHMGAWKVAIHPNDPQTIYALTLAGIYRTTNNGFNWTSIRGTDLTRVQDGLMYSLAINYANPNSLLISGLTGITATSDGGTTWSSGNRGIYALSSFRLTSSPASDRVYLSSTYDGAFAIDTTDGSGVDLNNAQLAQFGGTGSIFTRAVTVQPGNPDRLFVGLPADIARSVDAGASWQLLDAPDFVEHIVPASADGQRLLAMSGFTSLFYTVNGGDDWTEITSLPVNELRAIASAPSNPQVVYLTGRSPSSSSDVVLRSTDGGDTWTTLNSFDYPLIWSIAVDPRNDQTVYAGTLDRLYKSTNGGTTWTEFEVFRSPSAQHQAITLDPHNPDIVYTGGDARIARSADGGQHWQELTEDVRSSWDVRSLAVDAQSRLYASTSGHGVHAISVQPDLALTVNAPTSVVVGATATYSYSVRNVGPFDATNIRTRVELPAGTTNVTATSPNATCTVAETVATCTSSVLLVDATATVTIGSVHPQAGALTVVASVEGDQTDPVSANNSVNSNVQVSQPAPPAPPASSGGGGGGGSFSLWMLLALLGLPRLRGNIGESLGGPPRRLQ